MASIRPSFVQRQAAGQGKGTESFLLLGGKGVGRVTETPGQAVGDKPACRRVLC